MAGSRNVVWKTAQGICATLTAAGFQALFAGGCVRDMLLGLPSHDIDIATSATPDQVLSLFPKTIAVGAKFGVVAVITKAGIFEVATFRRDGPYLDGRHPSSVNYTEEQEDARRRDFTVNAMFFDPAAGAVLDYVGGEADLRAGIIRAVGNAEERFREDRLRLLRAVRFAARMGFQIAPDTFAAMRLLAQDSVATSAERIRDEILKMLTEGHARTAFEIMEACGILAHVLPEVAAMRGVEQPAAFHPEGDVWNHTLLLLEQLPAGVSPTLAMAALLHDVGKPPTQTFEDRIRFNLHEKMGARMSEAVCARLRMSNHATQRVVWLVENHMRLKDFPGMRTHRRIRLAREDGFGELLALCRMDALASHGDTRFIDDIEACLADLDAQTMRPAPLLDGNDLIKMGYTPGPLFKRILRDIETLQLDGRLTDATAAQNHVRGNYPLPKHHGRESAS